VKLLDLPLHRVNVDLATPEDRQVVWTFPIHSAF
jgi:hypothetical protein